VKWHALLVAAVVATAGCGGSSGQVTIYAASSLTEAFQEIDPEARFNFASSGQLAAQIEEGAKADVYASADPHYARQLFRDDLAERPRLLVANQLVLAVPRSNPAGIRRLGDLSRRGVKLVLAAAGVPAGDYARRALAAHRDGPAILANVVSEEDDVKSVLGKLELGEADAGFVYSSDVVTADGRVRAVYPAIANPSYAIQIVRGGNDDRASAFLERVFSRAGQQALLRAGFVTVGRRAGEPLP